MIVIDRMDDSIAVLEFDGEMIEIPSSVLPEGCREGDILGFVRLDNSEALKEGNDRISRMKAISDICTDDIDL